MFLVLQSVPFCYLQNLFVSDLTFILYSFAT
nr:MAG TPA: hypothetical protein [Caudoviricetes sp.]